MNIYLNTETDFIHNGLGFLTDVLKANVTDNLNGDYSLYFEYKIDGHLNEYLKNENIVKCQVSDGSKQLFIIKNVIKTFDSIQVSCKHIFYLLLDNFVEDTAPTNLSCQPFLDWVLQRTNYPTQFQVFSDIANIRSARYVRKNPVEIILGDEPNSIVNLFGGEIRRDNFNIHFNKTIGNDNGVKLIIGKNITGINITIDTNSVYTRIMPQGFDGLFLPEKYVDSPLINNYINPKIYKVEFSDIKYDPEDETAYQDIEEAYSALRNATNELFESGIDKPIINVKVNWIELSKTNEYKNYSNLEKVMLGDILTVNLLGLVYKTKVIKTVYNPLTDRIESFEIGSSKANIGTSTNIIQKKVESINPNSILESAKDNATQLITQAMGGYVYKTQNEMFVMDTDNPNTAVKVWRWNMNGLGYSKNGIDGPYEIAMTSDGQIVADFITTGKLNTNVIEGYDEVVIKVESQDNKIAKVTQTVEELNSKISDIADITISGEDTDAQVEFENINQSEPIRIVIRPIGENISYIYPSENLFPSEDLFLKVRTVRFNNIKTGEIFDYELPEDLLYYDEENYDEFILDYDGQSCVVNKRVEYNADGTTYVLDNPKTVEYEYPTIQLTDGDYTVSLLGYENAYLFVRLMAQNIYTTQFATRAEVNSEVSQTANKINSEIDQKLSNYTTTTEMNNKITQEITKSENKISLEVSEKVDDKEYTKANIIAKINDDTSEAQINADVIKLTADDILDLIAGNAINLTSKNITIDSDNFTVDKNGNVQLISTSSSPNFVVKDKNGNKLTVIGSYIIFEDSEGNISNYNKNGLDLSGSNSNVQLTKTGDINYLSFRQDGVRTVYLADNYGNGSNSALLLRSKNTDGNYCKVMDDSINLYYNNSNKITLYNTGTVQCVELIQTSLEKNKKNFEKYGNALEEIKKIDIYKYNLEDEDEDHKKHLGFVIGDNYNYSHEITAVDKNGEEIGVDNYSMTSLCLQAIKEQQEQIELLKKEIELLKNKESDN